MKKFFLVAAMAAFVLTGINAQNKYKPEAMTFSTELSYSPGGGATDGSFTLSEYRFSNPEYGAKIRLHWNENIALRLNLGLNTNGTKHTEFYEDANQKEQERYTRSTQTTFSIMPGIEYHFAKYERISPYVGAEIGILTSMQKDRTDNTENDNETIVKRPGLGFGINALSGVDVYLCKGLYLGFELKLGYESIDSKRNSTTIITGSETNKDNGDIADLTTSFGFHATPSLRVGWCF